MTGRLLRSCGVVVALTLLATLTAAAAAPSTLRAPPRTITVAVGPHPIGVAVHTGTHEAFVTDIDDGTVSVIDPATRRVKHVTQVGAGPGDIAVNSAADEAYLVRGPGWLTVLSTQTYAVVANIAVGAAPNQVTYDNYGYAYVTSFSASTLTIVNIRARSIVRTMPVGTSPTAVAVQPDTRTIYVSHYDSRDLWIIPTPHGELIQKIPFGGPLAAVTVNPRNDVIYLVERFHSRMVALDPTTYSLLWSVPVGSWVTDIQLDLSAGRAGRALIPDQTGASVALVNLQSHRVVRTVPVGNHATSVAADAGTGYVTNQSSQSVSVFRN